MAQRKVLRAWITKEANIIYSMLSDTKVDKAEIEARFELVTAKYERLKVIDETIYHELTENEEALKEETLIAELDKCGEYDIKYLTIKRKVTDLMDRDTVDSINSLSATPRHLRLPKIELKKFDGDVKNWIAFWAQFSKIHEDENLRDEDKFEYLSQCMKPGSPAQKLVDNFPPSKENYNKAVDLLKARFGKESTLIEYYTRQLLGLVLTKNNNRSITQLYDSLESQLRSLDSLNVTKEKYAAIIFPLVESTLPDDVFKIWDRHRATKDISTKEPEICLTELLAFIRIEVDGEERCNLRKEALEIKSENVGKVHNYNLKNKGAICDVPSAAVLVSTDSIKNNSDASRGNTCIFCNRATHNSQDCAIAIDSSLEERLDAIKKAGGCFKCLRKGHLAAKCKVFAKCSICKGKHYALICNNSVTGKTKEEKSEKTVAAFTRDTVGITYLQTLVCKINNNQLVRVLCDGASQRSYIKKSMAESLSLNSSGKVLLTHELFGGHKKALSSYNTSHIILSNLNTDECCEVEVVVTDRICEGVPRVSSQLVSFLQTQGIILTDFSECSVGHSEDIDVLLGANAWSQIITAEYLQLENNLLAVKTRLGWTVIGTEFNNNTSCTSSVLFNVSNCSDLNQFWELETMGIKDPTERKIKKDRDKEVIKFFNNTVSRDNTGRYIVRLPWIEGHPLLESNFELAKKRLMITSQKLKRLNKFSDYDLVIKDWTTKEIVEKIEDDLIPSHYLPHRAVIKEQGTTKLRPVFDASCKDKNGNYLNNCLEVGPNLIDLIPLVMTKFRKYPIGLSADIEKAFLQIQIDSRDRDMLRFLWWEEGRVKTFRHKRVVFGVCCSPFLLVAVLNHVLEHAPQHLLKFANELKGTFYIDNCLVGVDKESDIEQFIVGASELMALAGFNLRGWVNPKTVSPDKVEKVLGLNWYCYRDELGGGVAAEAGLVTRRSILSITHKIFDPIGFLAPIVLVPKILLQRTWKLKTTWDEVLPKDISDEFLRWAQHLRDILECRIPRRIYLNDTSTLHVFVDASKKAFGACIFLRTAVDGEIKLSLILAKARVAPLKQLTLPRLELMAALLGVRLYRLAIECLEAPNLCTTFWSDSAVALAWIEKRGQWSVFIENRVKEIQEYSKPNAWRHIPGDCNPADLVSRGCSPEKLLKSRWWEGPQWLKNTEAEWPSSEPIPEMAELERERRKVVIAAKNSSAQTVITRLTTRFSKYNKMVRTLAWILRFKTKKSGNKSEHIDSVEYEYAERILLRLVQEESLFGEERRKQLKSLDVFKDEQGLLRMKSKVVDTDNTKEYTYPIVLPSKHLVVQRMIEQLHLLHNHASTQTLLLTLREEVWILQGRRTVGAVVRKCLRCRRNDAKALEVPFPPLPTDRTNMCSTFQMTGIDLAGPLFLKGGEKGWVVIFTCGVYRAVHLELVTSLSTTAFIQALRRFVARRGRIKIIYSDNGTNFIGLNNAWNQLDWEKIREYSDLKKIKWKFNPPTAAWWGGFWERLIGILKRLLRKNLGTASLSYEEMVTLLCDCESVMNSRPLTYVTESDDEPMALTPSMFVQSLRGNDVTDLDLIQSKSLAARWRYLQEIRKCLRVRFQKEYLGFLRSRKRSRRGDIRVGDIVLIGNDDKKRFAWPLAKVEELIPGKDGVVRLVRVKTTTGLLLRPIQRIYQLEVRAADEDQSPSFHFESKEVDEEEESMPASLNEASGHNLSELKRTRCGREIRAAQKLNL